MKIWTKTGNDGQARGMSDSQQTAHVVAGQDNALSLVRVQHEQGQRSVLASKVVELLRHGSTIPYVRGTSKDGQRRARMGDT